MRRSLLFLRSKQYRIFSAAGVGNSTAAAGVFVLCFDGWYAMIL